MFRTLIEKTWVGCVAIIFLFCLWEAFSYYFESLRFVLPAPSKIFFTLWKQSDRFFLHTFSTMKEMVGGFLLAFAIGFPLAWLMALFGPLRMMLQPIFVAIQCVPMFALAPIMVLWFGWSYTAIVVPTALMIFFPLTISIYQGLCATPRSLLEFFYLHQASLWQTFYKLQLPWAMPHVFGGFRIAVAIAGIGAVAGEWAGAQQGLGILMLESRRGADIEMMFGAMFCLTLMSIFFYILTVYFEARIGKHLNRRPAFGRVIAGVFFVMFALGGCQKTEEKNKETKILLDWVPNPNHVPLYVGVKLGFFEENGINLKILKVPDPGESIPYLTSNQIDLCLTYMPHTIKAQSVGAKVVPIGILIQEPLNAIIYRKHEGIDVPTDLNDKIVGYCVDGYHTKFLDAMFSQINLIPKEMHNVSFDLVSTLATKQVDAIYGAYWNIEIENMRMWDVEAGYFPLSEFGVPNYYELIILANADGPYTQPEMVKAFQKALQMSIDFSRAHPDQAFDIYLNANPDKGQKTRTWERESWRKTIPLLARSQVVEPDVWNTFVDWLVEKKLIDPK